MIQKIAAIIAEAIAWGDNPYNDMDAREGFCYKEGMDIMREKIADAIVNTLWKSTEDYHVYMLRVADQILSLPINEVLLDDRPLTVGEALSKVKEMVGALNDLVDDELCEFDHHGYCQTHGWAGSPCPHRRGREILNGKRMVKA